MPWCPKCKMEYQDEVSVCSDCKVDLVESLEDAVVFVSLVQTEDQQIADKLSAYLEYSGVKSEVSYNEENEIYVVSVDQKTEKQARKLYKAFYYVESNNQINAAMEELSKKTARMTRSEEASGDLDPEADTNPEALIDSSEGTEEQEEAGPEADELYPPDEVEERDTRAYVMKADQYKDLAGTVWIFLFFGIAGLIFVVLNVVGIVTVLNGWLPNAVMGALFLFFLYVAASTQQKAKKIQAEIDAENKLTEEIYQWLEANITKEFIDSIRSDDISEELNYIKASETIKEMLIKEFGNQNPAYLDRLIDEYYSNSIDHAPE